MENINSDTYIVGVGLSAGGLNPLYALFKNPIPTNASFVIIQHLPQDYKSNLKSMLAAHTPHKIKEVENGMPVEAGSIYVMT